MRYIGAVYLVKLFCRSCCNHAVSYRHCSIVHCHELVFFLRWLIRNIVRSVWLDERCFFTSEKLSYGKPPHFWRENWQADFNFQHERRLHYDILHHASSIPDGISDTDKILSNKLQLKGTRGASVLWERKVRRNKTLTVKLLTLEGTLTKHLI